MTIKFFTERLLILKINKCYAYLQIRENETVLSWFCRVEKVNALRLLSPAKYNLALTIKYKEIDCSVLVLLEIRSEIGASETYLLVCFDSMVKNLI